MQTFFWVMVAYVSQFQHLLQGQLMLLEHYKTLLAQELLLGQQLHMHFY